jgi:hypothetical protein
MDRRSTGPLTPGDEWSLTVTPGHHSSQVGQHSDPDGADSQADGPTSESNFGAWYIYGARLWNLIRSVAH